jgi:hypothetical protein
VAKKPQSWAPEWMPYTIIGDRTGQDYEVSADIYLDDGGWAGVMGRVNNVGTGYGCVPKGYYLRLGPDGSCALFATTQARRRRLRNRWKTACRGNCSRCRGQSMAQLETAILRRNHHRLC